MTINIDLTQDVLDKMEALAFKNARSRKAQIEFIIKEMADKLPLPVKEPKCQ